MFSHRFNFSQIYFVNFIIKHYKLCVVLKVMCSSLGSSDSVAGHLVTLKFYKNNFKKNYMTLIYIY